MSSTLLDARANRLGLSDASYWQAPSESFRLADPAPAVRIRRGRVAENCGWIATLSEPPSWAGSIASVDWNPAPRLRMAQQSLDRLLDLPWNWDSYGASPIHVESVTASIDLLTNIMRDDTPGPAVVPTSHGFVQLEWHRGGIDLEIEVRSFGKYLVYFEDSRVGENWNLEIGWDLGRLVDCVSKLSEPNRTT